MKYDATPLIDYLNDKKVLFELHHHPRSVSAMRTAAVQHVSGKHFAKAVVVRGGGRPLLAVLPAHLRLDLDKLSRLSRIDDLELVEEAEFFNLFPNCEVGAMPPFGHMFDMDIYIDDDIAVAPEVHFNACTHSHTISLSGKDFLKAAEGVVGDISADPET